MAFALKGEDWIAHYRILAPLGAGGMGEVYRARDRSLERDVALKILPPDVVTDDERVRRFEREAKSASSLNHPHIVHIYEIGEDEVHGSAEAHSPLLHYIAMELVQGETLSAKIHDKRNDLKTLLGWLAQAAEGVAKAHAAGIVHRDLKPGNIMVSDDGYAKVLDFGLAKLMERQPGESGASSAPTRTVQQHTHEGAVLGTVGYMAPEQVRGQPVDARADVFAFGCMLYEAATRRRPFAADSDVETLHRILHDVPTPIEQLNPGVPAELQRLIRRCLAKDPNQRLDSMRTLALELREIVGEYETPSSSPSHEGNAQRAPTGRHRLRYPLLAGIALAMACAMVAGLMSLVAQHPSGVNSNMTMKAIEVPMADFGVPGFSRDGHWIALPARDERGHYGLYYLNTQGGAIRPIDVDSTVSVYAADISPDGGSIAYMAVNERSSRNEIRVIPTLGGVPRVMGPDGQSPRWSPDGRQIGYIVPPQWSRLVSFEFWIVNSNGARPHRVFVDSTSRGSYYGFAWSPRGDKIAWLRNFANGAYNEIVVRTLATGGERQITHDQGTIEDLDWTKQDEILFSSNRNGASNIWMIRPSGGTPVQVTRGAGPDATMRASGDGRTMLYMVQQEFASIGWWNVETGESGQTTSQDQPFMLPMAISPDGRQIALRVLDLGMVSLTGKLVIMNRDGSEQRTLVQSDDQPAAFDWSPDGTHIAWVARHPASLDSVDMHIVDAKTGESLVSSDITVPRGFLLMYWISPDSILITGSRVGSAIYSISQERVVQRTNELLYPNHVPGWMVSLHQKRDALFQGLCVRPAAGGSDRLVMPLNWWTAYPSECSFLYCWPDSLGFRRLELPTGTLSRVKHEPPSGRDTFQPTRDGSIVFWFKQRDTSKLVLAENVH